MNPIISLGDIEASTLRYLIGNRALSKAGLAVNSTTNTYRIALGGTVQADDIITITVITEAGTVSDDYTVLGSEGSIGGIATAVELIVEALTGVASAVASTTNIDVTPATTTEGIQVSVAVTKAVGDPALTASVSQTILGAKGIKTANTVTYTIDGKVYSQTTQTNIVLGGEAIPASSFKWWLVVADADGNITTVPGTNGQNILPDIPESKTAIGAVKISTAAATVFTPGTTGLNATGITDAYHDLSCVPTAGYPD